MISFSLKSLSSNIQTSYTNSYLLGSCVVEQNFTDLTAKEMGEGGLHVSVRSSAKGTIIFTSGSSELAKWK